MSATPVLGSLPSLPPSARKYPTTPGIRLRIDPADHEIEPTPVQVMGGHTMHQFDDFTNSSSFDMIEPTSSVEGTPRLSEDFGFSGPNSIGDSEEEQEKVRHMFVSPFRIYGWVQQSARISQPSPRYRVSVPVELLHCVQLPHPFLLRYCARYALGLLFLLKKQHVLKVEENASRLRCSSVQLMLSAG